MVEVLVKLLLVTRSGLRSRARLEAENPVLRQQVIVLSCKSPSRVWLRNIDRLIFVWMYRLFPWKCCNFEDGDAGVPARNWAARSQAARSNSLSMN